MCALLAACGTRHAGEPTAAPPSPAQETCGLDLTTDQAAGGNAGPPTDQETGYAGPPTDGETGYAGPPTDGDTGLPDPPTDEGTGAAGPPTDGEVTNGAGPCGGAGWFDLTRDFNTYYAAHRTGADSLMPTRPVQEARVRKARDAGEALVTFTTDSVGKGEGEDGRRVAQVFAAWRKEVYGDTGTVVVRTSRGDVVATTPW